MWLRMSEQILAQAPQHSQPSASRLSGQRWWPAAGRSEQWGHRAYAALSSSLMGPPSRRICEEHSSFGGALQNRARGVLRNTSSSEQEAVGSPGLLKLPGVCDSEVTPV